MNILIAPNAFKGSVSALVAAQHVRTGVQRIFPDAVCVERPIADGGDGTMAVIVNALNGTYRTAEVMGPLGEMVVAQYGLVNGGKTAVIEMATACGIHLVESARLNPMLATTYGMGQLIAKCLDQGCERIIVGVGGSATVDGGIGMAQALGAKLLDADGQNIGYGGNGLRDLVSIDISTLDSRIEHTEIIVACDVENPLTGDEGAARVFGPQKGATPEMVITLENALADYSRIIERDLGKSVGNRPRTGAAGGVSTGLFAFLNAALDSGSDTILDLLDMSRYVQDADLVITGEGKLDSQTIYGKAPIAIARLAKQYGVPTIAIAGCLADDVDVVFDHGVNGLLAIVTCPMPLEDAMQNAPKLIESAAEYAMRLIRVGMGLDGT
jgi:glycerate kinase